jgi:hypothetical protein
MVDLLILLVLYFFPIVLMVRENLVDDRYTCLCAFLWLPLIMLGLGGLLVTGNDNWMNDLVDKLEAWIQ